MCAPDNFYVETVKNKTARHPEVRADLPRQPDRAGDSEEQGKDLARPGGEVLVGDSRRRARGRNGHVDRH